MTPKYQPKAEQLLSFVQNVCHKDCEGCLKDKTPCKKNNPFSSKLITNLKSMIENMESRRCEENSHIIDRMILQYFISAIASMDAENKCEERSNRVYLHKEDTVPLTPEKLAQIAGRNFVPSDFMENGRLSGTQCFCNGNGEFVLDKDNVKGEKQYMQCRKCGEVSHL